MVTQEARLRRWQTTAYVTWSAVGILLLLSVTGYALGRISAAIVPFVIAAIIVFLMQGPVASFERRGMARNAAVGVCFAIALGLLTLVMTFVAPAVVRQLTELAKSVPDWIDQGQATFETLQQQYSQLVIPDWLRNLVAALVSSISSIVVSFGRSAAEFILAAGGGIATGFFDVFIAFVVAFWVLKDLPKMRDELVMLAGEKRETDVENLILTVNRVVGGYLKGQTIVSAITATLAGIGLAILGVPYVLLLSVITFFSNFVPYVGPFVAGAAAAMVAIFDGGPWQAVWAIVIVIAAQNITDNLITPRIMSEQVDLHPTLVIFSLLVGGTLFGLPGMIFAIPVAATGKGLFVYYFERRTSRSLASEDGAFFRTVTPSSDEEEPDSEGDTSEPDEPRSET